MTASPHILLVEDNQADQRLTREALLSIEAGVVLDIVSDGVEAVRFLRREGIYEGKRRPSLILLDLNLPRRDGREVLAEIKADPDLRRIPVIVLTTSKADEDILNSYNFHANCYLAKPVDLDAFFDLIRSIYDFWFRRVELPQ